MAVSDERILGSSDEVSKLAGRGRKDSHREKIENDIFDLNS